jgi:hypothetical protein
MAKVKKPHFVIKNKFQKRSEQYKDILTKKILTEVCEKVTGRKDYTVTYDNTGYNVGRLAKLEYNDSVNYISFSEFEIEGRNSFFQSFPSALVQFYQEKNRKKKIFFYFLPPDGNIQTPYFIFMYRLMKTAGTVFLNEKSYIKNSIATFSSVSDIIAQRNFNRGKNKGNASTYITVDEDSVAQIFGKTYGASKYETALLCLAIHQITINPIEIYEIKEGGLNKLPASAREIILSLGVSVITSNLVIKKDKEEFEKNDSLRSPTYIHNLLEKLGEKKCSLCKCEIPEIIQGAHIWPVSSIKKINSLTPDKKLQLAIDGENGLWLCNNHHKLFDSNILFITDKGRVKYKLAVIKDHEDYISDITKNYQVPTEIRTRTFVQYLHKRNSRLNEKAYSFIK